jgi:hypothetical protein
MKEGFFQSSLCHTPENVKKDTDHSASFLIFPLTNGKESSTEFHTAPGNRTEFEAAGGAMPARGS